MWSPTVAKVVPCEPKPNNSFIFFICSPVTPGFTLVSKRVTFTSLCVPPILTVCQIVRGSETRGTIAGEISFHIGRLYWSLLSDKAFSKFLDSSGW